MAATVITSPASRPQYGVALDSKDPTKVKVHPTEIEYIADEKGNASAAFRTVNIRRTLAATFVAETVAYCCKVLDGNKIGYIPVERVGNTFCIRVNGLPVVLGTVKEVDK